MEYDENGKSIIIDNGTGSIKAALSSEKDSKIVIPNCIGIPNSIDFSHKDKKSYFFGEEIEPIKKELTLKYPISRGIIQDWDLMEKIWGYILYQLSKAPEECNVMLTEPVINASNQAEKMMQIMFDTFNISGFHITYPAFLSFYSTGKLTGIAVDSGESLTQYLAVLEGFEFFPGRKDLIELGGQDLTEYLVRLMKEIQSIPIDKEKDIAKQVKEKACYVSLDYNEELKHVEPFEYKLPDNTSIIIKEQRIKCCEALFNPNLAGIDYDENIVEFCNNCIKKYDFNSRYDLYSNIVLSGGNTMFEGFLERFTEKIKALAGNNYGKVVNVVAPPEKNLAAVNGGCILSSLSDFQKMWITRNEYQESGASIVYRKKLI